MRQMRNLKWSTRVLGVGAVVALISASCGGDSDDESDAADTPSASVESSAEADEPEPTAPAMEELAAPDDVSLQICGGTSTNAAAYWAAEGTGLFDAVEEQFGTTIELDTSFAGGGECIAAFIGGENDMTSTGPAGMLTVAGSGEDIVLLMDLHNGTGLLIVGAVNQQESRGTDLANWADSDFAVTAPGQTTEVVPRAVLQGSGVDIDTINFLPVGSVPAQVSALEAGQAHAAATGIDAGIQMIEAGVAYEVLNLNDGELVRPLIGDVLGPFGLSAQRAFIEAYPELTQAIVDALYQGLLRVQEAGGDPDTTLALFPPDIQEAVGENFDQSWPYIYPAIANVDPTFSQAEVDDTISYGRTFSGAEYGEFSEGLFDNSFVLQARKTLGITGDDVPVNPVERG